MPFTLPSLDDVHEMLIADFANRFPNHSVSRFSDNWKRLRVLALAVVELHSHIKTVDDDIMPDTATGDRLARIGAVYNVTQKPATVAQKADALRVVGTAGSAFTNTDQLTHSDGTRFRLDESGTIPAAGFIDVDIVAIDTGSIGRKSAGEVLTFVSPPSGVESKAELQIDIDEDGDDLESEGEYRARILDKIAQPGMGGNSNDYRTWAEEVTGIADAYVFPLRNGLGSVDLAALHSYSGEPSSASPHPRALTSTERDELQDYIDERRPVSVADFRVLTTTEDPEDVEILIEVYDDAAYRFDWDDSTPLEVQSWTAGTRTMVFTADRPDDMAIGDRIVYKSTGAPYGTGQEYTIESLSSTDAVVLTEAPTNPPVAGDLVYSGGPLVQTIRDRVLEHMHALGPARDAYAAGTWDGTLRTAALLKLALVTGVSDATVSVPSANVTPTNVPPASSIGFVVPRQVIVRQAP